MAFRAPRRRRRRRKRKKDKRKGKVKEERRKKGAKERKKRDSKRSLNYTIDDRHHLKLSFPLSGWEFLDLDPCFANAICLPSLTVRPHHAQDGLCVERKKKKNKKITKRPPIAANPNTISCPAPIPSPSLLPFRLERDQCSRTRTSTKMYWSNSR